MPPYHDDSAGTYTWYTLSRKHSPYGEQGSHSLPEKATKRSRMVTDSKVLPALAPRSASHVAPIDVIILGPEQSGWGTYTADCTPYVVLLGGVVWVCSAGAGADAGAAAASSLRCAYKYTPREGSRRERRVTGMVRKNSDFTYIHNSPEHHIWRRFSIYGRFALQEGEE